MPESPSNKSRQRFIYTISQLNNEAKELLEGTFPLIWVEGELSNFSIPASGHWYFTLKDPQAQARCAMFKMRNNLVTFRPKNGDQVLIRARVSLYAPRGDYQLIAEHMEEAGDGALRRAFEELKARLEKEGLFAAERKRPIPVQPRAIGVVTSPTGAAIRDIITVLKRRYPAIPVIIYPVAVQGSGAADEICEAIELASERAECDVLIVGRGGGSLEDLWSFNEERVARAICNSQIPVISAVGHEIDYTISDFVADQRAATPSAAAEMVSPDRTEQLALLRRHEQRLIRTMENQLRDQKQQLNWLHRSLQHPKQRLQDNAQRVDELERRMTHALKHRQRHDQQQLAILNARLERLNPLHGLQQYQLQFRKLSQQLTSAMGYLIKSKQQQLASSAHNLDTVSPLATLKRGYAIVEKPETRAIVRSITELTPGETIDIRLANGKVRSEVKELVND